ncbi:hypothetical protein L484_025844 [Morus notabilis]|uniref:Uncharacterized protein n=1 Tax=Morus notabilis TaxID=981085 RepID=W9RR11_9ROSA|nr:hypothetical protein L484_025844 [Morus notabilis]
MACAVLCQSAVRPATEQFPRTFHSIFRRPFHQDRCRSLHQMEMCALLHEAGWHLALNGIVCAASIRACAAPFVLKVMLVLACSKPRSYSGSYAKSSPAPLLEHFISRFEYLHATEHISRLERHQEFILTNSYFGSLNLTLFRIKFGYHRNTIPMVGAYCR